MLLIPFRTPVSGRLHLDAFSFQIREIESVFQYLKRKRIEFNVSDLINDFKGRIGRRFTIGSPEVKKFEESLNLKFTGYGKATTIRWVKEGNGDSFKCQRVDSPPNDCETILADDEHTAVIKCALVASSNNWLGGVPTRGQC